MSRTRRKFPPNLRREDYTDSGDFIVRGHCSMPKFLFPIDQVWSPKAKKLRKKINTRRIRRGDREFDAVDG